MKGVVVDQEHADHGATAMAWIEPGGDPPAARLTRAAGQFAAERADALGHPGQAAAGSAGYAGAAGAVVLDFDAYLARGEPQPDGRARARACVLHRVRQGFLDEPEDDQLDAGGRVPGQDRCVRTGPAARPPGPG